MTKHNRFNEEHRDHCDDCREAYEAFCEEQDDDTRLDELSQAEEDEAA